MPSPFPGMDPYLERHWGDVHTRLITYIADHLNDQMPSDLKARVEEYVSVQSPEERASGFYPDVRVVEKDVGTKSQDISRAGTAVAEPFIVPLEIEPPTQRAIRIIDTRSGNRIITAIELLSSTNKINETGRTEYRRKQRDLMRGQVNLVEIDLLRAGEFVLAIPVYGIPANGQAPYRISVVRATHPEQAEYYPISLNDRLPAFRIPLRPTDQDVVFDLQMILNRAYENGRYDDIDYSVDAVPPLTGNDAAWADALLREKGMR